MLPALLVALSAALAALWLLRFPRYRVGHTVWTVGTQSEAMEGTITGVIPDGYILSIPQLKGKTPEYYISKKHAKDHLRPRST